LPRIATEIGTGHEVWLTRGRLVEALRASYTLSGIFAPVRIGGRWLVDGALINPVPGRGSARSVPGSSSPSISTPIYLAETQPLPIMVQTRMTRSRTKSSPTATVYAACSARNNW
jgi:NTE family protein